MAGQAFGERPPEPAPAAERLVLEARGHFDGKRYDQAARVLQRAYALDADPQLLFSIAQCQRLAERYEDAQRSYQRFLRVLPAGSPGFLREEAKLQIDSLGLLIDKQRQIEAERRRPVWRRRWFWGLLGGAMAVAAGAAVGVGVAVTNRPPDLRLGAGPDDWQPVR